MRENLRSEAILARHRQTARRWLGPAVASLLLAGLFSGMLIVGRVPPFSEWVTDPGFFKRALVVHVDLALIVWFYAFATCWYRSASGRCAGG